MKTMEGPDGTSGAEPGADSLVAAVRDVVDAATTLAERAAESAADLAAQAVRDAGRVARSFESLIDAAAREGVEIARDAIEAVREAAEHANETTSGRWPEGPEGPEGREAGEA